MAEVESVKWIRAAAAVALFASCHPKAPPKAPPPPEVAVVTVKPESVPETYEFSAEVVPYRRVEVRSRIDGIIESRPFTEGSTVRRGQVRYTSGVASYVEVLDAQRSLFDAELSLSRARLQELEAAVQLYRAIGGSWNPTR